MKTAFADVKASDYKAKSLKSLTNEVSNRKLSLTNDRVKRTERIADNLVEKFDAPSSRNFFLKCAWHLSESVIWTIYEISQEKKVKQPLRYFVAACNRELHNQ